MVGYNNQRNSETPIQKLDKPIFSFKITNDAESRNSKIPSEFNGNIGSEIAVQSKSPLNYVS